MPMSIKQHLMGLQRVSPNQKRSAVRQLDMSNLKFDPFTADIGPIFAPVELEGFPGLEHQRYIGAAPGCLLSAVPFVTPGPRKSRDAFMGAVISQLHQISMHLLDCASFFA